MAAGRYDVSRKRDFRYSKRENHGYKYGYHEKELNRGRGHRGAEHRIAHRSPLSTTNSGGRSNGRRQRDGFGDRTVDQEHGDLYGRSGSADGFDFESWVGDTGIAKFEDGTPMPFEKKRKFSPIVWDRDDKEVRISSKNRIVPTSSLHSPPSVGELLNVISDDRIKRDPVAVNQTQGLQISPAEPPMATGLAETGVSESVADLTASFSPEQCRIKGPGLEKVKEEEYIKEQNTSTSKWAYVDSSKTVSDTNISSPESGEFWREGFEGNRENSSRSPKACHFIGVASGDEYSENELDNDDVMEIDEKYDEVAGVSHLHSNSEDDDDFGRIEAPVVPKHSRINMLQGCRSVFEYEMLGKINEGTYGVVFRAKDKKTGDTAALKKVKMRKEIDGFPVSALREINILMSLHHPSIIDVKEVVMDDLDGVFMVMEYMEHDLKGLMEVMRQPLSQSEVKCLMLQLLEGVKYLHDNWVLHRDLKMSNILLNNRGELKICDFGLSRQYGSPLKPCTPLVVTLWYRAPELLLGTKQYSTAIDMWSVGCIMAELLAKKPLFDEKTELKQLDKIFRTLGTPNETIWPGFSNLPGVKVNFVKQPYSLLRKIFPAATFTGSPVLTELGFDLLNKLLTYDPEKRITAKDALNHGWFCEIPLLKPKEFLPKFPAQHAKTRKLMNHSNRA